MKRLILICCSLLLTAALYAQNGKDPSTWTMNVVPVINAYNLVFRVDLQPGWHIWALNPGGDGTLIAPAFLFSKGSYTRIDTVQENGKLTEVAMEGIEGNVRYFTGRVEFIQQVKASAGTVVKGEYTYQLCSETICLPPKTAPFSFRIP